MQRDPENHELAALRAFVKTRSGASMLELGCGDGRLLERTRSLGVDTIGVDPTISAVARARRRDGALRVLVADAARLPFRNGCFDQAVFGWSL